MRLSFDLKFKGSSEDDLNDQIEEFLNALQEEYNIDNIDEEILETNDPGLDGSADLMSIKDRNDYNSNKGVF
jgi:hypothetical protein